MTVTNSATGSSINVPTADEERLVIVGATGMVGGYALRYGLDHPAVGTVTAIGRKTLGISHPKLKEVLHQDFTDCSALSEALSRQDAAVYCLGTYTGAVTDAELRKTTVDYTAEFARVLRSSSPGVAFSFLSGNGADPTGRKSHPLRAPQGRGRERTPRGRVPPRLHLPTRVHLSRRTAEGTQFDLPPATDDVSGVSSAVPQPGHSVRRLGPSHGRCRGPKNRRAPNPGFGES